MKDGKEYERLILLKPHKQEIVRTRVGEIADSKDLVICEFTLEKRKGLSVEEAKDVFRNQYLISDEKLIEKLARNLADVMGFSEEDLDKLTDRYRKGALAEFIVFDKTVDYTKPIDYHKAFYYTDESSSTTHIVIDFVFEHDNLEVKYREATFLKIPEEVNEFLKQMYGYRENWKKSGRRAVYMFRELQEDDWNYLKNIIEGKFGDTSEWLVLLRGWGELEQYMAKRYRKG